jgi:hypothetical protein
MKHLWTGLVFATLALWPAAAGAAEGTAAPAAVTFNEHVAPIIFQNCTSCHRHGEAAPFPLTNYQEVKKRASLITKVTKSRFMPPWHAEPCDVAFADVRRLNDAQIQMLQDWVKAGLPEGDSAKLPKLPTFPQGWQLGQPDLIVKMPRAYKVRADGRDIYRNFVVPLNLKEDKWVRAIEFRPTATKSVHHTLFFLDTTGSARKMDEASAVPGFSAMGRFTRGSGLGGSSLTGSGLGGWAVGAAPPQLPEGLAYKVPKGSDLILSTHFHPSGKEEMEQSVVGLYFARERPKQSFANIQLPPVFGALAGVNIPAGAKKYTKKDAFVLPVDVKAFGASAHAHYLGKDITMTAKLPDGTVKQLLVIKKWDFNWQEQYNYKDFVYLPKGTRLEGTVIWDNSADNPNNPNNPPRRVRWGKESTDEMGSVTLKVVAVHESDMPQLRQAIQKHLRDSFQRGLGQAEGAGLLDRLRKGLGRPNGK